MYIITKYVILRLNVYEVYIYLRKMKSFNCNDILATYIVTIYTFFYFVNLNDLVHLKSYIIN